MLLALLFSALAADPVTHGPRGFVFSDAGGHNTFSPGLSFQPRLTLNLLGDDQVDDAQALTESGFRIRRMLLTARGTLAGRIDYNFRANFAQFLSFADVNGKTQWASKPLLDDAAVTLRIAEPLAIQFGQWKVPFTASMMMADSALLFPDRPVAIDGFKAADLTWTGFSHSRDAGLAVHGKAATAHLDYSVGVFNGDGVNVWPTPNEGPLIVARLQAAPMGALQYDEVDFSHTSPKIAMAFAGTWQPQPIYNAAGARIGATEDLRLGTELRLAAAGLSLQSELLWGLQQNRVTSESNQSLGGYAQVGYFFSPGLAPGIRWSRLDPSLETAADGITSLEAVLNWYLPNPQKPGQTMEHRAQLQLSGGSRLVDDQSTALSHQVQLAATIGI